MGFKKEPLHLEFVKLSHHGSIRNINKDFFDLIRSNQYIICNHSPVSKKLSNKETIAQIAFYGKTTKNNETKQVLITKKSPMHLNFDESDHEKFNFEIIYQADIWKY
ncbi:hypothetical protein VSS37_13280 [Candidatus Thiothrix sp. Deng01]|uniref:Uncharacterized protein n=1 Tax=Candidatus Thiothrix phosphatis TaxID=3112415 RepID=A0ABU6CYT3_9GAMM|nr:hypothetical protein [Candidatus Thiothrix sp. Deng01]MEB4591959.1 hypothetical protein [Candidatus Thiothrix sp. Deng01]